MFACPELNNITYSRYGIPSMKDDCCIACQVGHNRVLAIDCFDILKFSLAAMPRGHKQRKLNLRA